ncbi:hypothetical protein VFPBJ_02315 [Purpureocillium lilacinum]|uniref:Uncharacterized protein n=1 Tax=Purpureocillium lilacinum TaxID=33203 RepID=A0A179GZX0_PURLI|nr:hypothetical protein VFPBJ_02315 [Purpureocillium lilacinum]
MAAKRPGLRPGPHDAQRSLQLSKIPCHLEDRDIPRAGLGPFHPIRPVDLARRRRAFIATAPAHEDPVVFPPFGEPARELPIEKTNDLRLGLVIH